MKSPGGVHCDEKQFFPDLVTESFFSDFIRYINVTVTAINYRHFDLNSAIFGRDIVALSVLSHRSNTTVGLCVVFCIFLHLVTEWKP